MKITLRFPKLIALLAAVSFSTAAIAQPPQGGPPGPQGAAGAPGKKKKGGAPTAGVPGIAQQRGGKNRRGPQAMVTPPMLNRAGPPIPIPPPPPPYLRHSTRVVRVTENSSDSIVSSVQQALKQRGYYTGSVDGVTGPGTRGAITGFRTDNGLGNSTKIDSTLMSALGL